MSEKLIVIWDQLLELYERRKQAQRCGDGSTVAAMQRRIRSLETMAALLRARRTGLVH
jgi:hypothetical protein